jgi:hypothetical protein
MAKTQLIDGNHRTASHAVPAGGLKSPLSQPGVAAAVIREASLSGINHQVKSVHHDAIVDTVARAMLKHEQRF